MIGFVLKVLGKKYFITILQSIAEISTCFICYKYSLNVLIPILETLTHIMDSFSFGKEITTYDSSLYMVNLDVESLTTKTPLNEELIILLVIFIIKIFIKENSAKESFSNF